MIQDKQDFLVLPLGEWVIKQGRYSDMGLELGPARFRLLDWAVLQDLRSSDLVLLTGKPGAGKSHMLMTIGGHLHPSLMGLLLCYDMGIADCVSRFEAMADRSVAEDVYGLSDSNVCYNKQLFLDALLMTDFEAWQTRMLALRAERGFQLVLIDDLTHMAAAMQLSVQTLLVLLKQFGRLNNVLIVAAYANAEGADLSGFCHRILQVEQTAPYEFCLRTLHSRYSSIGTETVVKLNSALWP